MACWFANEPGPPYWRILMPLVVLGLLTIAASMGTVVCLRGMGYQCSSDLVNAGDGYCYRPANTTATVRFPADYASCPEWPWWIGGAAALAMVFLCFVWTLCLGDPNKIDAWCNR
jgi:hypothetical protein